jgi:hypothetical protein
MSYLKSVNNLAKFNSPAIQLKLHYYQVPTVKSHRSALYGQGFKVNQAVKKIVKVNLFRDKWCVSYRTI